MLVICLTLVGTLTNQIHARYAEGVCGEVQGGGMWSHMQRGYVEENTIGCH